MPQQRAREALLSALTERAATKGSAHPLWPLYAALNNAGEQQLAERFLRKIDQARRDEPTMRIDGELHNELAMTVDNPSSDQLPYALLVEIDNALAVRRHEIHDEHSTAASFCKLVIEGALNNPKLRSVTEITARLRRLETIYPVCEDGEFTYLRNAFTGIAVDASVAPAFEPGPHPRQGPLYRSPTSLFTIRDGAVYALDPNLQAIEPAVFHLDDYTHGAPASVALGAVESVPNSARSFAEMLRRSGSPGGVIAGVVATLKSTQPSTIAQQMWNKMAHAPASLRWRTIGGLLPQAALIYAAAGLNLGMAEGASSGVIAGPESMFGVTQGASGSLAFSGVAVGSLDVTAAGALAATVAQTNAALSAGGAFAPGPRRPTALQMADEPGGPIEVIDFGPHLDPPTIKAKIASMLKEAAAELQSERGAVPSADLGRALRERFNFKLEKYIAAENQVIEAQFGKGMMYWDPIRAYAKAYIDGVFSILKRRAQALGKPPSSMPPSGN